MKHLSHLFSAAALSVGLAVVPAVWAVPARAEMTLVMVEEQGCIWCARWNAEIAPIYPKTAEGRAAPLQRMDINDPVPEGMSFARKLHFTPTFVLVQDGQEAGRIEGYPGEDFFWGLLGQLIARATAPEDAG